MKTINQIEDHHKRENSVIYAVTYVTYVCNLRIAHPYCVQMAYEHVM